MAAGATNAEQAGAAGSGTRAGRKSIAFSGDVKVGDLISATAIILSGFGIVQSVDQANELTQQEQTSRRSAAMGKAVARLDRWQALQASLEPELDPVIVHTAETLKRTRDPAAARDRFWEEATAAYAALERRIGAEQLDIGYEDVIIHLPDARALYLTTYNRLRDLALATINQVRARAQDEISLISPDDYDDTSVLGNRLRTVLAEEFAAEAAQAGQLTRAPRVAFCRWIGRDEAQRAACARQPEDG